MKVSMVNGDLVITAPVAQWLDPDQERSQYIRLSPGDTRLLAGEILRLLKEDLVDEPIA